MELHPHRIHFRSLILTFFLAVCVIVIGVVYRYQESGFFVPQDKDDVSNVRPTEIPKSSDTSEFQDNKINKAPVVANRPVDVKTQFKLETENRKSGLGDTVVVTVFASSAGKKPVGYDAIVEISGGQYDIVSTKSLDERFNLIKFVKNSRITLTGVLSTKFKEANAWDNTPIAQIVVKPKAVGQLKFEISDISGRETSKIMIKNDAGVTEKLFSASSDAVVVDISK
ncbi:MAG: hypothetical protein U0525_05280 [Patescibacteria group bacterium]